VLDYTHIDEWIYTNDQDSFQVARRLIREEGLLVGGSSGSAVWAMLKAVRETPGVRKALTILPDSVRNYLTKFINDDWMREHGFLDEDAD
jgi:cysteine synthase